MGKKYLDTKKDSLEQSVLGVWKTAVEEGSARMVVHGTDIEVIWCPITKMYWEK